MGSLTKALIGKEDVDVNDNELYPSTFSRLNSTGSTITLTSFPDIWKTHQNAINARSYGTQVGATINTAVAAGTTCRDIYLDAGEWVVSNTIDWSSYTTTRWIFAGGAYLTLNAGVTVTLPSPYNIIAAPNQQIFSGAGTVAFSLSGIIYPNWWGTDQDAINAAITSAAAGSQIRLLPGTYTITGSATQCILINKAVDFVGSGPQETTLSVAAATGATIDIIRVDITGTVTKMHIRDFNITPVSGTPGRYGIYIDLDAAGQVWDYSVIQDILIEQLGDYALYVNATASDRFFDNHIYRNTFKGGTYFKGLGDSVWFEKNLTMGTNYGFYADCIAGACGLRIRDNTMINTNGGIYLEDADNPVIEGNEFEAPNHNTTAESAFVVLKGGAGPILQYVIRDNNFICTPANVDYALYIDDCHYGLIEGNYFQLGDVSRMIAYLTANSINTIFRDNDVPDAIAETKITDLGTHTVWKSSLDTFYAFVDKDATPSVAEGHNFITANTGATTITTFDNPWLYKKILIQIGDAFTIIDFSGTNLIGNGGIDWYPNAGEWMEAWYDGANWYCSVHHKYDEAWFTFADGDATPSVAIGNHFITANTGPTTITTFHDPVNYKRILVQFTDAVTTVDFTGTNLKGNGGADWTPASGDFMECFFTGTNWYCAVHDCTA